LTKQCKILIVMRKETTQETLDKLNAEVAAALAQKRNLFFFPESNRKDDPLGIKAFHQGDLDITDGHLDMTTREKTSTESKTHKVSKSS